MMRYSYNHLGIKYSVCMLNTFLSRFLGALYFSLNEHDLLIFSPGESIHTFFMKIPIDVYFLDKDKKIISRHKNVLPWRVVLCPKGTKFTIETHNRHPYTVCHLIEKWKIE